MQLKVPIRIRGDKSQTGLEAERVFDATEWFTLANRFDSALRVVVARALENYQLTVIESVVLSTIAKADDNTYTVTNIAHMFDMNTPQTTVLLAGLVKRNLIKTKTDGRDRRVKLISCTRSGRKVAFESDEHVQHAMRYWLFDLTDAEIEAYQSILKKITSFDLPS